MGIVSSTENKNERLKSGDSERDDEQNKHERLESEIRERIYCTEEELMMESVKRTIQEELRRKFKMMNDELMELKRDLNRTCEEEKETFDLIGNLAFVRSIKSTKLDLSDYVEDPVKISPRTIKKFANGIMKAEEEIFVKKNTAKGKIVLAWKTGHNSYMELHIIESSYYVEKIVLLREHSGKYQKVGELAEFAYLRQGHCQIMNDREWKNRMDNKNCIEKISELIQILQPLLNKILLTLPSFKRFETIIHSNCIIKGLLHSVLNYFDTFDNLVTDEHDREELMQMRKTLLNPAVEEETREEWISKNYGKLAKWQCELLQIILNMVQTGDFKVCEQKNWNLKSSHRVKGTDTKILYLEFSAEKCNRNCKSYKELISARLSDEEEPEPEPPTCSIIAQKSTGWVENNIMIKPLWNTPKVYWYVPTEQDLLRGFEFVDKSYPIVLSSMRPSKKAEKIYWRFPTDTDEMAHIYDAYKDQQEGL